MGGEQAVLGWVVEWAPGKYVKDGDVTCLWSAKWKAEKQAAQQRKFSGAWEGIRAVPVYVDEAATERTTDGE